MPTPHSTVSLRSTTVAEAVGRRLVAGETLGHREGEREGSAAYMREREREGSAAAHGRERERELDG